MRELTANSINSKAHMSSWAESSKVSPSLAGSVSTGEPASPRSESSSQWGTTTSSAGGSSRAVTASAGSYSYGAAHDSRDVLLRLEYASDSEAKVGTCTGSCSLCIAGAGPAPPAPPAGSSPAAAIAIACKAHSILCVLVVLLVVRNCASATPPPPPFCLSFACVGLQSVASVQAMASHRPGVLLCVHEVLITCI